jgi:4-aminobutyrate aminotransferase-like enzyme
VIVPPRDYWRAVTDICRRNGILVISDEVVTAFGRLGSWFASESYGIEPDLITTAKGLTSGYLPLGPISGPVNLSLLSAAIACTRCSAVRCGIDLGAEDRSTSPSSPSAR